MNTLEAQAILDGLRRARPTNWTDLPNRKAGWAWRAAVEEVVGVLLKQDGHYLTKQHMLDRAGLEVE